MENVAQKTFKSLSQLTLDELVRYQAEMARRKAPYLKSVEEMVLLRINRWASFSLDAALRMNGLEVFHESHEYALPGVFIRGELECTARKIIIYDPVMDELKEMAWCLPLNPGESERLEDIVRAHELYHFLEYLDGKAEGDFSGEIGAHIFSMRFLGLSFYPWILDMLQMARRYGHSPVQTPRNKALQNS